MLQTIPETEIPDLYRAAQADGNGGTPEAFAEYVAVWNAQVPLINGVCNGDPDGWLGRITDMVMKYGAAPIAAYVSRRAAEGALCPKCAEGAHAAIKLAIAGIGLVAPQYLIAEAELLTRAAVS